MRRAVWLVTLLLVAMSAAAIDAEAPLARPTTVHDRVDELTRVTSLPLTSMRYSVIVLSSSTELAGQVMTTSGPSGKVVRLEPPGKEGLQAARSAVSAPTATIVPNSFLCFM